MLDRVFLRNTKKLNTALFIIPLMQALLPHQQITLRSETSYTETRQEVRQEIEESMLALGADAVTQTSRLLPSVSYRHPEIPEKGLLARQKQEREEAVAAEAAAQAKAARDKDIEVKQKKKVTQKRQVENVAAHQEGAGGQRVRVSASAYCSTPAQTSGDPFITASGARVAENIISTNFLPFGATVTFSELRGFEGRVFTVGDRMSKRYWHAVDFWMPTCQQAVQFGRKNVTLEVVGQ